jgi:carbon-monoxide dehydrogenase iron sulfur subunit
LKRIHVDAERCSGCRFCEMICSFKHEGRFSPNLSRIRVVKEDKHGFDYPVFCHQCDSCPSVAACPVDALSRTEVGIIQLNKDACTGCGSCKDACTFEALELDESSRPLACDLCGGKPICVSRCPTNAISFVDSEAEFPRPELESRRLLRKWGIID